MEGVRTPRCQTIQRVSCWIILADNFVIVDYRRLFEISMIPIFFFSRRKICCFPNGDFFFLRFNSVLRRETIRLKIRSETYTTTSVLFQCIYLEKDGRNTRVSVWRLFVSSYRQFRSASTFLFSSWENQSSWEILPKYIYISIISNLFQILSFNKLYTFFFYSYRILY